jgi:membrane associated rhomboid family serine protease
MLIPTQAKNPPESLPIGTYLLIALNILVFLFTTDSFSIREDVVMNYGLTGLNFSFVTVMSSMFLHGDIYHLISNLWMLIVVGCAVEGRLRTWFYLPVYLLSGFCGDLLHHLTFGRIDPEMPSIGASGAVMGMLGAGLYMFFFGRINVFYIFPPLILFGRMPIGITTWPLWGVALFFLGLDLLFVFLLGMNSGVGHLAHLGGAAGGFLLVALLRARRDSRDVSVAKETLAETQDYSSLSVRELEHLHEVNPTDGLIVLHWLEKARSTGQGRAKAEAVFRKMLPALLRDQPIESVASCMIGINHPGKFGPAAWLNLAAELERARFADLALKAYEMAYGEPAATSADHEACLFRVGILCENVLGNPHRALASYNALLQTYPLSSFAPAARARKEQLEARLR